jgi:hypothetical protein
MKNKKNTKKYKNPKTKLKKPREKRIHIYLCYTNLLLIISILYFFLNSQKLTEKPIIEYLLASFLILTIIFSQLFWNNPIKHSIIHRIDAIIAKIVIFSFIFYTIIYKFTFSYLIVLLSITVSFYFSNFYSNEEWCSTQHLFCHGLLHIFCFIATFYAFTPIL